MKQKTEEKQSRTEQVQNGVVREKSRRESNEDVKEGSRRRQRRGFYVWYVIGGSVREKEVNVRWSAKEREREEEESHRFGYCVHKKIKYYNDEEFNEKACNVRRRRK